MGSSQSKNAPPASKVLPPKRQWQDLVTAGLLAAVLFFVPLFPDVKLTRPKLLLLEAGLYSALFLWLFLQFFRSSVSVRKSLLLLPLFFYALAGSLLYIYSPDKPIALNELKRCLLSLCAYLVAANAISSIRSRNIVLTGMLSGSFLAILYGLLQHTGGIGMIAVPAMSRIMSTFGNPIFFAAHIVCVLPIAIGLLLSQRSAWRRLLLIVFIAASLAALYYTQTRAAYIAFGSSLLIMLLMGTRSGKTRLLLAGTLLIGAGIFAFMTRDIWSRQQAHLLIWRDSMAMWAQNPLLGTGPGTFHIYFPGFASEQLRSIWPQEQFIVNDAHNEYVQFLTETGIVGFGIFLWLLITFLVLAWRRVRTVESSDRPLALGLCAAACGILIQNIFSVDMRFIISSVYLFLIMGLLETFSSGFWKKDNLPAFARTSGIAAVGAAAFFILPAVFTPYLAQKKVSATPDFFDMKVLEPAKTIADLEVLALQHPDQPLVFEKLGWVYSKERMWEKAINSYERASELDPKAAGPLNNLGNIYFLQNNRPMAIGYWNRSLGINPKQVDSRLNLAVAYYYQGLLKESAEQLKAVLKLEPNNEKAIVLLKQMSE